MVNAVLFKRIAKDADHRLLSDQGGEILRPVFPSQYLIGTVGFVGHGAVDPRVMIRGYDAGRLG